ncbi:protealysin inhibitor emfourin [Nocardia bovistercoris]|uniref:Uncharacterized protein n=1 Tax=Nocardia bovistercoris TaxID=2785916 RepID=A0A931IJ87_9NOCA|nr:protealysin inhibitor emfourin [Nocardia bovistercoris]MBH0780685.1 hypothetical protein [Nocardia bovistercoris]
MRISLDTYGGLTGGFGNPSVVVVTDRLDGHARAELDRLIRAAVATRHRPAPEADSDRSRDAQTYEITIDAADAETVVLSAVDGNVSEEFARLRDWLRDHSDESELNGDKR